MLKKLFSGAADFFVKALIYVFGLSGFGAKVNHRYKIECFEYEGGPLKWVKEFNNLVTTAGLNQYLDAALKTGLASPAWFVGLVTAKSGAYDAGDTMASHSGWTDGQPYSEGARQAWTPGTIASGSVSNTASPAIFSINTSATIYGAFMTDSSTLAGTSGTLLGVGDLGSAQSVNSGNSLQITIIASLEAA